jgi:hypothetical protein
MCCMQRLNKLMVGFVGVYSNNSNNNYYYNNNSEHNNNIISAVMVNVILYCW